MGTDRQREVDVDFNAQELMITATYDAVLFGVRNFSIAADHESAFITDGTRRVSADEVSENILEKFFFPD